MKYLYLVTFLFIISCEKKNHENSSFTAKTLGFSKAEYFYEHEKMDSAFKYFNEASSYYLLKKDSIRYASCLGYLSIISLRQGDYYGCEEINTSAIKYLKQPRDNKYLLSIYNSIAVSRKNLKDYKTAIIWYRKALNAASNPEDKIIIRNNIAIANVKMKNYSEAITILDSLFFNTKGTQNNKTKSKILDNLAYTKFLQNSKYKAEKELYDALNMRTKDADIWGLNASYAHLSDFYSNTNKEKALSYAHKMYEVATILKSPDDKLEALQKLIVLENNSKSKEYFNVYQKLDDSLKIARNKAKNQFALIRYETEKNKADFLKSQAENSQKENQILKQYVILITLSLVLIGSLFWYRRRRKRLQQEKELEIKNTQLKMSKKVHDVVANGIYQVMTKIENQKDFDRDKALDELEFVYEKSRDISYDKIGEEKEFSKVVSELIASFNNDTVKTFTAGNSPAIWESVSPTVKEEVYQMIRELMVNMKKHSHASHVALKFEKTNNIVEIQYKDNGIGIPGDLVYKNGLRNAASRIEAINGTLTFETKIEKGLKVNLSFPVS